MSFATSQTHTTAQPPFGWLARAEGWMDARGKPAWIAAMVLAFVLVWPLGLALLGYMLWRGKVTCSGPRAARVPVQTGPTGNSAFDAYRADTLSRLERDQTEFEAFLQRLRDARDKSEFDQFMSDRARTASHPVATDPDAPSAPDRA